MKPIIQIFVINKTTWALIPQLSQSITLFTSSPPPTTTLPSPDGKTKPPRSRSRLSMKLSKFSLKRRQSSSTPTTPCIEDQVKL